MSKFSSFLNFFVLFLPRCGWLVVSLLQAKGLDIPPDPINPTTHNCGEGGTVINEGVEESGRLVD